MPFSGAPDEGSKDFTMEDVAFYRLGIASHAELIARDRLASMHLF